MANDIEHLAVCLFVISISTLVKCLFAPCVHFWMGLCVLLLLSREVLCMFYMRPLDQVCSLQTFSPVYCAPDEFLSHLFTSQLSAAGICCDEWIGKGRLHLRISSGVQMKSHSCCTHHIHVREWWTHAGGLGSRPSSASRWASPHLLVSVSLFVGRIGPLHTNLLRRCVSLSLDGKQTKRSSSSCEGKVLGSETTERLTWNTFLLFNWEFSKISHCNNNLQNSLAFSTSWKYYVLSS